MRPRTAEHPDYRGYAGRIEAGPLRVGDPVVVLPSGQTSSVTGIDTPDGSLSEAGAGRSVVVRLADELDIARGDLIAVDREPRPVSVREVEVTLCWLSDRPLREGDRFRLRHTTRDVRAVVDSIDNRLDVATLEHGDAEELRLNDIGTPGCVPPSRSSSTRTRSTARPERSCSSTRTAAPPWLPEWSPRPRDPLRPATMMR